MCLHPLIIICIVIWGISINAHVLERQMGVTEGGKADQKGTTELSDYSSFLDDNEESNADIVGALP